MTHAKVHRWLKLCVTDWFILLLFSVHGWSQVCRQNYPKQPPRLDKAGGDRRHSLWNLVQQWFCRQSQSLAAFKLHQRYKYSFTVRAPTDLIVNYILANETCFKQSCPSFPKLKSELLLMYLYIFFQLHARSWWDSLANAKNTLILFPWGWPWVRTTSTEAGISVALYSRTCPYLTGCWTPTSLQKGQVSNGFFILGQFDSGHFLMVFRQCLCCFIRLCI